MVSKWSSEDVKFLDVYEEFEGFFFWNNRHSDYKNEIKCDSTMLKLMGELFKGNVALESVEVVRKKIKSIKTCTGKRLRRLKNAGKKWSMS
jgi:ppGpp synthetase/RelA/SpoT-type nucleotidyltranferase